MLYVIYQIVDFLPLTLCAIGAYIAGRWVFTSGKALFSGRGSALKKKALTLAGFILSTALCIAFSVGVSGSIYADFMMKPAPAKNEASANPALPVSKDAAYVDKTEDEYVSKIALEEKAEDGDAEAQHMLGTMYRSGQGEPRDDVQAVQWERKSAEQGNVDAQAVLGTMYYIGAGVPQDYEEAYAWSNLAAAQSHEIAQRMRDAIAGKLSPDALSRAQQLSKQYFFRYAKQDNRG